MWPSEAVIPGRRSWSKNLKGNIGNEMAIGYFEKLQYIPGNWEEHTQIKGCAHTCARQTWKALYLTVTALGKLHANRKWRLRWSCKLSTLALETYPNTHTHTHTQLPLALAQRPVYSRIFKNPSLTINWPPS